MEYLRNFGSQYPEATITLSNYKDIGDASEEVKQLIQQFYTFINANNYASASALFETNKTKLLPFYVGMETFNKLEEEIYNTQIYSEKEAAVIISETAPDISNYTAISAWLKPVS